MEVTVTVKLKATLESEFEQMDSPDAKREKIRRAACEAVRRSLAYTYDNVGFEHSLDEWVSFEPKEIE